MTFSPSIPLANMVIRLYPDGEQATAIEMIGWGLCLSLSIVLLGLAVRYRRKQPFRALAGLVAIGLLFWSVYICNRPVRDYNRKLTIERRSEQPPDPTFMDDNR